MNAILSNPVSSMRTLIPFTGGNWSDVLDNEVFQAIIKSPPSFWGLDYRGFQITDMTQVDTDDSGNTARSGGTKLKKNDIEKGWDVSERPLIVVWVGQELYLWDGFNRWWKLNDMGEVYAPTWVYQLKEGFDMEDVKEHVQLSANNSARADEHTKRDFINTGLRWAERHGIEDLDKIIEWVNRSEHSWNKRQVDVISSSIYLESETAHVRHISTGSKAKKEAYDFVGAELTYGTEDTVENPLVLCTKVDDYIQDAFVQHMKKYVQDDRDGKELETTELIGYTKGCDTAEGVKDQRQHARDKFDEYDALVVNYAMLKMKLNGKVPYKWLGFLPQLYGVECGDGIENKLVD
tara:strand:- start:1015 stop:2061 length:1047 start_codon:yes stop_codon:yes gene_type:complete